MSQVATTARLKTNPKGQYSKHNGLLFTIALHTGTGVALLLPYTDGGVYREVDFTLAEVELIGSRPEHLQAGDAEHAARFAEQPVLDEPAPVATDEAQPPRLYKLAGSGFPLYYLSKVAAVQCLIARRYNQPHIEHSLLDPDGYLVPSTEFAPVLAGMRQEAERLLLQVAEHERLQAPAYQPEPTAPAAEHAEQAIKRAREKQRQLPAAEAPAAPAYYALSTSYAGQSVAWVNGSGTVGEGQQFLLSYIDERRAAGCPVIDCRDWSEPCPAGMLEVGLWLLWVNKITLTRRFFVGNAPKGEGPAGESAPTAPAAPVAEAAAPGAAAEPLAMLSESAAPEHQLTGLAAASLAAGLEAWQRRALIDMAGTSADTPADVLQLLQACTDEQLVLAAGFAPMLPALLQSELPAGHAALTGRPLFTVGNQGPTATLPLYRPGVVLGVQFAHESTDLARAFYEGLPKTLLATWHPIENNSPGCPTVVQCWVNNATAGAATRGARFYKALQVLLDSLPVPAAPGTRPRPAPRPFGTAAPVLPVGAGTGELFS